MCSIAETRKSFVNANREFFRRRVENTKPIDGIILVDPQSTSEFFLTEVMKIAAALRDVMRKELVVINAIRADSAARAIVNSYMPGVVVNIAKLMLTGLVCRGFRVIRVAAKLSTGSGLVAHNEGKYEIGSCIYDTLLRRMGLASISRLTLKQRLYVLMELAYFYGLLRYVERHAVNFVVLPDNAYRNGLLFEIARVKALPSIVGIDLNGMSMHRYATAGDYNYYCRTPDEKIVQHVTDSPILLNRAEEYIRLRTTGQEKQHDVMRAYSAADMLSKAELMQEYGLDPARKTVLVMAHIFCDAPHAYPGMLFKDFEEWLVSTCARLSQNGRVNFVVKEHPSAALYGEEGLTARTLEKNGIRDKVLNRQVNTKSLFHSIDVMITCGGTSGMEFPCFGVPVLVAARPPYCHEKFIRCPSTGGEYLSELDRIHQYEKHDEEDCRRAMAVLYVIQSVMKVPRDGIGLGTHDYYLGSQIDMADFFKEMVDDCRSGAGYSSLVSAVSRFIQGPYANFVDDNKIKPSPMPN